VAVTLVVVALAVGVVGCAAPGVPEPRAFPVSGVFDYQLGGAYPPPADVTVVERDSTARPAPGTYGVCYVNGFQTQPQDGASWRAHHPDVILRTASGRPASDPGWPGEMLLDTSTAARRAEIAHALGGTVRRCARRGFDAVEFDNLDSWTRSHGRLHQADALAMARLLVQEAHRAGLAAGQKNTAELGSRGRRVAGFDFAIAEECMQYDECGAYTRAYGHRVVDIEYTDELRQPFATVCASPSRPRMTVLRDRELLPPSSPDHRYRHC
jgi:hypothetical protein